ncbi:hypothetical protein YYG_00142 [Plasmodium vinckei petteri]|uniref:Uncharacterized protein n=1 Tax=Plasmodium vinckei petteri TaxID=138298 RepID=W7AQR3_PLAVN|nr:hypothetical protein YYG_00142 [Plasmodium vinckei petteri]CAD2113171.1 conserved Plasmodium protein, unknown function [Plasmodium vinckei petteri]
MDRKINNKGEEKQNIPNNDDLKFLKFYSNTLFKYAEEEKEQSELFGFADKLENKKKWLKINIDLILIILFFIVIYTSNSVVKVKNFQNFLYNDINESRTFSETFYKSISDDIKKINNNFSYNPQKKDFIIFKNIRSKFELSSWIKNAFTEKVAQDKFLNNNILFGKCWRITMRLYKKNHNEPINIYKDKKIYEIYPDDYFSNELENTQDISSTYFGTDWNYLFSYGKSYKKLGGLYQIICEENKERMHEQLSQGTYYSIDYPYFIPAIILTNYNIASVSLDFLLYNPLLNILSYNILKFSFLPNAKTHKELTTLSASTSQLNNYIFFISLSIFIILLVIQISKNVRKFMLVGFRLYAKSYSVKFALLVTFIFNLAILGIYILYQFYLPNIQVLFDEGKYEFDGFYSKINNNNIVDLIDNVGSQLSTIEFIRNIFIGSSIISFIICSYVFINQFGVLIQKYNNVEKNIKTDFLYPFFIIIIIMFGCLGIFSLFSYKLFSLPEKINSSMLNVFILNACIIFGNFQRFNIYSIKNKDNFISYFYSVSLLIFIITISYSVIFFITIKSFFKRNKKLRDMFTNLYSKKLIKHDKKNEENEKDDKYISRSNSKYKDEDDIEPLSNEIVQNKTKNINMLEKRASKTDNINNYNTPKAKKEHYNERYEHSNKNMTNVIYDKSLETHNNDIKKYKSGGLSSDSSGSSSYLSNDSNVYEIDTNNLNYADLNYKDILNMGKNQNNQTHLNDRKNLEEQKKSIFFNIEQILDIFLNMNNTIMPLSYKEKKRILKKYNKYKTKHRRTIFSIYLCTSIIMFILLFLISDFNKGKEHEDLLRYQIENIVYPPNINLVDTMKYHNLNKFINVNIHNESLNFNKIGNRNDIIEWIKNSFTGFLKNGSNIGEHNMNPNYRKFKWIDIFNIRNESVKIRIRFREKMKSTNNILTCDYALKNCYTNLKQKERFERNLNKISLLINDSTEEIKISFILYDNIDQHSVLVNIRFIITPNGHIKKSIIFDHLFFNSFNIFQIKGIIINLMFAIILISLVINIYMHFFKIFSYFKNICLSILYSSNNTNTTADGCMPSDLNNFYGPEENMHTSYDFNNYNYNNQQLIDFYTANQYGSYPDYYTPNNFGGNYAENYGGIYPNNYNGFDTHMYQKDYKSTTKILLKLKIFFIYIFECDLLNLIICLFQISTIILWLVMSIYINKIEYYHDFMDIYYDIYITLFGIFSKFRSLFYLVIFFLIINMFIFLSDIIKKEKLFEALRLNKRQIAKFGFILLFVYLNFFLFNYFFYGLDGFNDMTISQKFMHSALILSGFASIEIYLKCNFFYFIMFILPHLIFIRFLFIYSLLSPILVSYLILIKKPPTKKKRKKNIINKKDEDYSNFKLTHLSNEQWKYLNEDIKNFSEDETQKMLMYFEYFKMNLEKDNDVSMILKKESELLMERAKSLKLDLHKIELQWKFGTKLLSSSNAYIEKMNKQITANEETISLDKKKISTLRKYAEQLNLDSENVNRIDKKQQK